MDPVQVVEDLAAAFNALDVERIVACFSPSAVIQDGDGNVFAQGQEAIRATFGPVVAHSPNLDVKILNRIHVGSWVVEEEQTTGFIFEGFPPDFHVINVYQVEDGKIIKNIAALS